jgi:hypothetical protein
MGDDIGTGAAESLIGADLLGVPVGVEKSVDAAAEGFFHEVEHGVLRRGCPAVHEHGAFACLERNDIAGEVDVQEQLVRNFLDLRERRRDRRGDRRGERALQHRPSIQAPH